MPLTDLVLWGAGASAREIAWLAEDGRSPEGEHFRVVCLIDDFERREGRSVHNLAVKSFEGALTAYPNAPIILAVGDSAARANMAAAASNRGLSFKSLVHRSVVLSRFSTIGTGVTVAANCVISVDTEIGDHAQLNFGCIISHDSIVGRYSTLACGVRVSGHVRIGERVMIGANAAIINGSRTEPLVIGDDATIGAGACVVASVMAAETVVGVPARPVSR